MFTVLLRMRYGVLNNHITDGFYYVNNDVYLLRVSGPNSGLEDDGYMVFAITSSISLNTWNIETYCLTDAVWFNNSQVDLLVVGGRCEKVLKDGMSCFAVTHAASFADWDFEEHSDGFTFATTQISYTVVGGLDGSGENSGRYGINIGNATSVTSWGIE